MSKSLIKQEDSKNDKSLINKTTKPNDSSSNHNEEHTNPLFNPELISKRNVIINSSTSKAMYRFPKAERFHPTKKDNSSFFYNLPSVANNRSTSIGYGTKTNFVPSTNGRSTNIYNIPREFDLNAKNNGSPKYTFGYGRDVCRVPKSKDEKTTPGPSTYSPYKKFGEKSENALGFTPDQRFFIAYAMSETENIRDEEVLHRTKIDEHSLSRWRVNGILPHVDAWYDAFDINEQDKMYVAPDKRVKLW